MSLLRINFRALMTMAVVSIGIEKMSLLKIKSRNRAVKYGLKYPVKKEMNHLVSQVSSGSPEFFMWSARVLSCLRRFFQNIFLRNCTTGNMSSKTPRAKNLLSVYRLITAFTTSSSSPPLIYSMYPTRKFRPWQYPTSGK